MVQLILDSKKPSLLKKGKNLVKGKVEQYLLTKISEEEHLSIE